MQKNDRPLIHVIGMEPEGLDTRDPRFSHFFQTCRILAGGSRHLESLSGPLPEELEKIVIRSNIDELCEQLNAFSGSSSGKNNCAVVLASGDPLFYGIGSRLLSRIPRDGIRFYPATTLVQRAFSLLGESWEDVRIASFHGRDPERLIPLLKQENRLALYTPGSEGPARILELIRMAGRTPGRFRVVENIGITGERIHQFQPENFDAIRQTGFEPLNIIILDFE